MIPRLYETYISDFNTEGLGSLKDLLTISITKNRNQIPTLAMTYPINASLSKDITEGMVIVADMGLEDDERNQQFRIVDVSKSMTSISITANHVWSDLSNIPLKKDISEAHAGPNRAFDLISDALAWPVSGVGFASDIPTVANLGWNFKELGNANAAIFGADQAGDQTTNTMEALYNGEFRFNNYYLTMLKHAGQDNGVVIKYGRNMQSITRDETTSGTYNAIMPYVTNTYEVPKTKVTANKVWTGGRDSVRPSLFFKLYRTLEGGTAEAVTDADQKEVPKTDGAVEWSDLPATDQNGVTYTYSVKEVDKDGNPVTTVDGYTSEQTAELTVTNK